MEYLTSLRQVVLTDFKFCIINPYFGEGKDLVRNQLKALFVDSTCSLHVFSNQFFKNSIVDPEIDISSHKEENKQQYRRQYFFS